MRLFITALACLLCFSVFGQNKKEIIQQQEVEITELSNLNSSLQQKVNSLKSEIDHKVTTLQGEIDDLKKELNKNLISTPDEFGESLFKIIKYRDFNQLDGVCINLNDTIYMSSEKQLDLIRNKREKITEGLLHLPEKMSKLHTNGISIGINWSQSYFVSVTHDGVYEHEGFELLDNLEITFRSKDNVYLIGLGDILLFNNEWKLGLNNFSLHDVAEEEKKEKERLDEKARQEKQAEIDFLNSPFTPKGLKFESGSWKYDGQRFAEFNLNISNNTEFTFKKIVYYFYIKDSYGNKEYARTHTLSRSIEPKDVITIKVPELDDLFIGEDISNQSTWDFGVEVVDCLPRQK